MAREVAARSGKEVTDNLAHLLNQPMSQGDFQTEQSLVQRQMVETLSSFVEITKVQLGTMNADPRVLHSEVPSMPQLSA